MKSRLNNATGAKKFATNSLFIVCGLLVANVRIADALADYKPQTTNIDYYTFTSA